jgi:hypothetical protein
LLKLNSLAAAFVTRTHGSFWEIQKRQSTAALQNVADIARAFQALAFWSAALQRRFLPRLAF